MSQPEHEVIDLSSQVIFAPDQGPRGIGVVAPHDLVLDEELRKWLPHRDAPPMFTTRTPHINVPVGVGMASQLSEREVLTAATRELVVANPAVTVFACTSASFIDGLAGERRCREAMLAGGANETITTSGAMLEALQALEIERVAVVTPYDEETTARLIDFLGEAGIKTVACGCLGMDSNIFRVTPAAVANLIRATNCDEAQAVFVSCTNLRTKEIIRPLERELGKPVVSANQATMWAALRAVGVQSSRLRTIVSWRRQERLFAV